MKLPVIALSVIMLTSLIACKQDSSTQMPEFGYLLPDSATIAYSDRIPIGKPIVIVNFEADCLECQQTTDSLLANMEQMKGVRFIFLTKEEFRKVRIFYMRYKLENYPNIAVGQDYLQTAHVFFKVRRTPLIALYNSQKYLMEVYDGKPVMEELIRSIKKLD